jgi:dolichyl-phosphate-mannose--protein O-mannosyl transferase
VASVPSKRILHSCLALFAVSQVFFLLNIQFPKTPNFDEFHYVPSAKQFLAMKENQNWEHPPLGKMLMAVGIAIGGDRPIGWRLMSTVFGALTLVGMFLWGLAVFRNERDAWFVALLTLFNQLLYVQARIGMLDTFMMAFLAWGFAAFSAAWDPALGAREVRRYLAFAGITLGLATATKWAAVVPWLCILMLYAGLLVFHYWELEFRQPVAGDWISPKLWNGVRIRDVALLLGVFPVLVYFATFLPYLFVDRRPRYGLWDLVQMQWKMWDGQLRVVTEHPYNSKWPGWPLMTRPIWYAYDKEGENFVRGVVLLGNPLLMWGGLVALAACAWGWITRRSREAFLVLAFYAALYFPWAAIPRKIAFYYYYYPAGMTLGLAVAYAFRILDDGRPARIGRWVFLGATVGIFVYFFPILAALKIGSESFRKWMWFSTWI